VAGVALMVGCLLDAAWLADRPTARRRTLISTMVAIALLYLTSTQRQKVRASAIALWEDSASKNPASVTAATGLGEPLREAGRLPEAEQAIREAIRLGGGNRGDDWATLALILDAQGQSTQARAALVKSLQIDPRLADPAARVKSLAMERPIAEELRKLLDKFAERDWPDSKKGGY